MLQHTLCVTVSGFREHYNIYLGDINTQTLLDHDVACPDLDRRSRLVQPCKSECFSSLHTPCWRGFSNRPAASTSNGGGLQLLQRALLFVAQVVACQSEIHVGVDVPKRISAVVAGPGKSQRKSILVFEQRRNRIGQLNLTA